MIRTLQQQRLPSLAASAATAGRSSLRSSLRVTLVSLACGAALLAGCGAKKESTASQTAAKVNKEEVTVHQINFVLQQQRGLRPEQADAASRQILERLIDQELALQKAQDDKLDRDPRVVQQLEAARREIIARAYVERISEGAAKPAAADVQKYYDEKPALFKERKIYSLQELQIDAKPEQIDSLRTALQQAKSINDFTEYLKTNNIRASGGQAVKPAEQLPLAMLDTLAKMGDGQAILTPTPTGAQVIVVASSRSEPIDLARATPAIEQYLYNDSRRKLAEAGMKSLRAGAKIEYVGKFATAASGAAGVATPESIATPPAGSATGASAATDTPAAPAARASAPAGLEANDISNGLGLKK